MTTGANGATNPGAEVDATGWSLIGTGTGTIARTTTAGQFRSGVGGFLLTKTTAAGNLLFALNPSIACQPLMPFYVEFWEKTAVTVRNVYCQADFFNGATYLTTITGVGAVDVTTGFTQYTLSGISPASTTLFQPYLEIDAAAISEVHYVDDAFVRAGTGARSQSSRR